MSLIAGNLSAIQRVLDGSAFTWAICGGAAAHLYGDRRPINDIDVLIAPGQLDRLAELLRQHQRVMQFDGHRLLWRSIKIFDMLTIRNGDRFYSFTLDQKAVERLRHMPLLGTPVPVLPPEDVALLKILLGRGPSQGKQDVNDAAGVVRRQKLDTAFLNERIKAMRAEQLATPVFGELGVELPHPTPTTIAH